jgi:enoyl-CoA hydratase
MQWKTIRLENQNAIWTLTLDRPQALNALNQELISELGEALNLISEKNLQEAKVLILTGAGEKAFVAGADIKEINQLGMDSAGKFASRGQAVFRQLENLQIPVIAAVNGFALGGGLELALACDFIYASDAAKFGLPEVTLGLIPGFGGTVRLSRVLNLPKAKEWIFTGQMFSAAQALAVGLVNQVFPPGELMAQVRKTAELIASRGPISIAAAKTAIQQAYDHDIDSALSLVATVFGNLFSSKDV